MNVEPFGVAIFCDDIRQEVTGKLTLVGCYTGELNFVNAAPGVLPTFAALVTLRIPKTVSFRTIKIRVLKEEGTDVSEIFRFETSVEVSKLDPPTERTDVPVDNDRVTTVTLPCQWTQVPIREAGFFKVRAYLDGGDEIRLGALKVNFPEPKATDPAPATDSE